MDNILNDIKIEREHQDNMWGGKSHDRKHSPGDWNSFRMVYEGKASQWSVDFSQKRKRLIQIAALCVAEIEVMDEQFSSSDPI